MIRKYHKAILASLLICMTIVSLKLAWDDSLTFDEVAHIPAGYTYVSQLDYRLNPEHPPLLKVLSGLAILPLQPHFDTTQSFWTQSNNFGEFGQWDAGRHILHQAGNDTDRIVFFARLPIVVLSVIFGLFIFYWGKKIGGIITGLFATILYALDPNVLGHNHFVTTDIGIAVAFGFAFYFFLHFLKIPSWKNACYGGIALGIAQVTKFSAIMLIPFFGILLISYALIKYKKQEVKRYKEVGTYLLKGIFAMSIMLIIIWVTYVPVTLHQPENVLPLIAEIKAQPEKYNRDTHLLNFILWANESSALRPLATYTQGLMQVLNRVDDGNVTYFLGNVSSEASQWYFPFVFLTKQTFIHLFFYTLAIVLFFTMIARNSTRVFSDKIKTSTARLRKFIVTRFHEISLGAFVVFYSYISITGNLNIGFRHLFPMMPLLYVLTAKVVIDSYKKLQNFQRKKLVRLSFIGLIIVLFITTLTAYPFYMSYFNQLVGGPKNGYNYVTDSNADWGQDLKRLKGYLDTHPEIDKIRITYFGGDDIHNRLGEEKYILWWDSKRPIEPGYYALSTFFLQESIFKTDRAFDDSFRWTQGLTPIDQVGTSFLIYKID